MSRYRLIEAFEHNTVLPIDLGQATQWLLDARIQNEITFVPAELDPQGAIRGFIHRYMRSKGGWDPEPELVSDIYYDPRQPTEWQNMVCAKELLHILDGACVTSKSAFDQLTQRLALPEDVNHLLNDPDFAFMDKAGTAPASALLLPMAARETLLPAYKAGLITAAEIARQAVMPVEHVRTVMSDLWLSVYPIIKKDDYGIRCAPAEEEPPVRRVKAIGQK
jgi:hypothetical protein